MEHKLLYLFRGWIAFVAFMDLGTAFRCYIEKRSFLGDTANSIFVEGDYTVSRILGIYLILKAISLVHCTLYIHYKATVSMAGCALILTILLYMSEALYFRSSITLIGLIIIPRKLRIWDTTPTIYQDEESSLLLKKMNGFKKRRITKSQQQMDS